MRSVCLAAVSLLLLAVLASSHKPLTASEVPAGWAEPEYSGDAATANNAAAPTTGTFVEIVESNTRSHKAARVASTTGTKAQTHSQAKAHGDGEVQMNINGQTVSMYPAAVIPGPWFGSFSARMDGMGNSIPPYAFDPNNYARLGPYRALTNKYSDGTSYPLNMQIMLPQLYDVISNYKPDLLFTDGEWDHTSDFWQSTKFLAWLFNESPVKDSIVINDRWGSETRGVDGGYFTPEYSATVSLTHAWEENSGIDLHSFGYNRNTPASLYNTPDALLKLLVRCVANNGNFLLDIGPTSDGRIPEIMQLTLEQMGAWLKVNGEAIYGSRIWRAQQEGPDIDNTTVRYTKNPDSGDVYALAIEWPGATLELTEPIPTDNTVVYMLGVDGPLKWTASPSGTGLSIELPTFSPKTLPCQSIWVFRLVAVK